MKAFISPAAFRRGRGARRFQFGVWRLKLFKTFVIGSCCVSLTALASVPPSTGLASWYGEAHRGKLMANGKRFNPDRLTAASWFYRSGGAHHRSRLWRLQEVRRARFRAGAGFCTPSQAATMNPIPICKSDVRAVPIHCAFQAIGKRKHRRIAD